MSALSGYKTYIVAAVCFLVGVDNALIQAGFHIPAIPDFVMWVLGAMGLYTVRNGISGDTQKAVTDILNQIGAGAPQAKNEQALGSSSVAATQHFATSKNSTAQP